MTQSNVASLPGSPHKYQVHPDAKRYTMLDNAFMQTKNGNFQYERVLAKQAGLKKAPKLKISVSKDFTDLKLSTVAANGVRKIDLYENDQLKEARDLAEFYLSTFVKEGILQKVE